MLKKEIADLKAQDLALLARVEDIQAKKHIVRREYEDISNGLLQHRDEAIQWTQKWKKTIEIRDRCCSD